MRTLQTKKFTPDLQIFYTFPVFGLNVHVLGVKVPTNAMKRIIFIKLYPTLYCQKIYPRPQDFLYGYIRNIRDILQLCPHTHKDTKTHSLAHKNTFAKHGNI